MSTEKLDPEILSKDTQIIHTSTRLVIRARTLECNGRGARGAGGSSPAAGCGSLASPAAGGCGRGAGASPAATYH